MDKFVKVADNTIGIRAIKSDLMRIAETILKNKKPLKEAFSDRPGLPDSLNSEAIEILKKYEIK
jgi:hypothetical protein